MQKAINIENSNKDVVRILSITDPDIIENNPTGRAYILVENFPEPPEREDHMVTNYCMYKRSIQEIIWKQVHYQYTATEELLEIENLKSENNMLKNQLQAALENINMLTETIADVLYGNR